MTHIITIQTQSESDFAKIKSFAERLGLHVEETHTENVLSEVEELQLLNRVAGSWVGDETGDELNAMIRNARYDSPRTIEL